MGAVVVVSVLEAVGSTGGSGGAIGVTFVILWEAGRGGPDLGLLVVPAASGGCCCDCFSGGTSGAGALGYTFRVCGLRSSGGVEVYALGHSGSARAAGEPLGEDFPGAFCVGKEAFPGCGE